MSEENDDRAIKVILLGEAGVGKTNLIRRAMGLDFDENIAATVLSSYYENDIVVDNMKYSYQLWDTAGQEKYHSLNKLFIKNSKIIIIIFSIDNRASFDKIDFWVNNTKEILGNDSYILSIVGNKSDLYEEQEIDDKTINEKVKELGIKYKLTSAANQDCGFPIFLNELLTDYINKYNPRGIPQEDSFTINKRKHLKKKKGFLQTIKNCCK